MATVVRSSPRKGDLRPSSDDQGGLRARKKLRTRRELERTALALFTERGFDDVTVDEIVTAADVSKRTFYRYFDSKEDVLFGDNDMLLEQIAKGFGRKAAPDDVMASVKEAMLALARRYEDDRDLVLARGRIMATTPCVAARNLERQAEWEERLAVLVGGALCLDPDLDVRPRLVAAAVIAGLRVATHQWLEQDGLGSLPATVADAFDLLGAGLASL
jgi:AcrR family transcriptional regulator